MQTILSEDQTTVLNEMGYVDAQDYLDKTLAAGVEELVDKRARNLYDAVVSATPKDVDNIKAILKVDDEFAPIAIPDINAQGV